MRFSSRVRNAHADLLILATCEIVYPRALCALYACFVARRSEMRSVFRRTVAVTF